MLLLRHKNVWRENCEITILALGGLVYRRTREERAHIMWVAKGVEKFVSVSMEQITKTNDRA